MRLWVYMCLLMWVCEVEGASIYIPISWLPAVADKVAIS